MPRRVALDIGAADPSAARDAAVRALTDDPDLHVEVVGPVVPGAGTDDRLTWHEATAPSPDVDPAVAVRGRADLSVRVALERARDGHVDTVVSASPMASLLTGVRFLLRRRVGVRDPLLAVMVRTDGDDVVVLDASGRPGTTPGSLLGGAMDLGQLPATVGLLAVGAADGRAADALSTQAGVEVRPVSAAEVLAGVVPVAFADGAAGGMLVDAVAALAPGRVGVRRVVGLDTRAAVVTVAPDPATWDVALGAAPVGVVA